ncbi:MmgE/PrpD family protein [Amycolatopsis anabasis]|uniref:MmgE/PrpD family protein n=1 Tax=Amycolatopsis anabasis TaxID=1840409 RepID=UPI001FE73A9A|nr:MmgE/PrpD family protein [Amycolatopsis anabasis]
MTTASPAPVLSDQVARFVSETRPEDVPAEVLERARYLILDAVGIAFASATQPFAAVARDALAAFGTGEHAVLGMRDRLSSRDAAVLNGVLIHGLDFDDTHLPAVAHTTSAVLPAALSAATSANATLRELLAAYVMGVELTARVGMAAGGAFHDVGYHPTSVAGAFGAAVAAGKLAGLDMPRLGMAQGIVGSMASGLMQFLDTGAWTKRLHPGWAALSGLTAASFAGAGWSGPPEVYEGRFGLYATHVGGHDVEPAVVAKDLGRTWELLRVAVKPYPMCHYNHAFTDAALALRGAHEFRLEDITEIRCAIHPISRKIVCEPADAKWKPRDEYDAKFSLPYAVSSALVRGRFTLAELEDSALRDPHILALAGRVRILDDPESAYPEAFSGAVEIELTDGTVLHHREQINRGHEKRPLTHEDIVAKFESNIAQAAGKTTADRVRETVLGLSPDTPATDFAEACRAE